MRRCRECTGGDAVRRARRCGIRSPSVAGELSSPLARNARRPRYVHRIQEFTVCCWFRASAISTKTRHVEDTLSPIAAYEADRGGERRFCVSHSPQRSVCRLMNRSRAGIVGRHAPKSYACAYRRLVAHGRLYARGGVTAVKPARRWRAARACAMSWWRC